MGNFIAGLIAVVLISSFLVFYAVTIRALPLAIIILFVLALIVVEFVQSVKEDKDQSGD